LVGVAELKWRDAVWFQRDESTFLIFYEGLSIQQVLDALGAEGFSFYDWASFEGILYRFTGNVTVVALGDTLVLESPWGTFTFDRESLGLREWSADGEDLRVLVYEDQQLYLLAATANPESEPIFLYLDGIPFFNPLYCAAAYGHTGVMYSIVDAGASLQPETRGELTALHVAADYSQTEAIELLLDAGMDIDVSTEDGVTPLIMAAGPLHKEPSPVQFDLRSDETAEQTDGHKLVLEYEVCRSKI
jgi:hypothetical protein